MSLSIEDGQASAQSLAVQNTQLYQQATNKFGRTLSEYKGDAPRPLGIGHILRVNPSLTVAPIPTQDRRRGFMFATAQMAKDAGIKWAKLDEPITCAYVWGRDINADSRNLYYSQTRFFPKPDSDFWKCSYLKHVLGDSAFSALWNIRDATQATIWDSLLYAVNGLNKSLPGWPVVKLKHTVIFGCVYVFELALRGGGLTSTNFGIQPVLRKNNYQQVFK